MTLRWITVAIALIGFFAAPTTPIMVQFGTTRDTHPLPQPRSDHFAVATAPQPTYALRPAPVSEAAADLTPPAPYRPLAPHQYRTRLHALRPPTQLALGTPLDRHYPLSAPKLDLYRKQQRLGAAYTGPHVFERQPYEVYELGEKLKLKREQEAGEEKTVLRPAAAYDGRRQVPQIGVIYSSGVRYYVPAVFGSENGAELENEVYGDGDVKYLYRGQQQQQQQEQ